VVFAVKHLLLIVKDAIQTVVLPVQTVTIIIQILQELVHNAHLQIVLPVKMVVVQHLLHAKLVLQGIT